MLKIEHPQHPKPIKEDSMWYFIILGIILLALNWILPMVTGSPWVYVIGTFELQLWLAGCVALGIGVIWLIIHAATSKK
jgi:hypothetical protein